MTTTTAEAFAALDSLLDENEDLKAENLLLKAQLDLARDQLATAKALSSRTGW